MSAILLTRSVLMVGYSMRDPDFRLLLDRQLSHFRGFAPERYALMRRVNSVEREVLWRTANIRVISYEEHEDLPLFFEALQREVLRVQISGRS